MGRLILFAMALVGIGIAISNLPATRAPRIAATSQPQEAAPAPMAHRPGEPMLVPGQAIELKRAANGHFLAEVTVNDLPLTMLVDTGATVVALTVDDARRLGLVVDPATFGVVGTGASGPVRGAAVTLQSVAMGARDVGPISAVVLEGLNRSLLGQSVLSKLDQVQIAGDTMTLRP